MAWLRRGFLYNFNIEEAILISRRINCGQPSILPEVFNEYRRGTDLDRDLFVRIFEIDSRKPGDLIVPTNPASPFFQKSISCDHCSVMRASSETRNASILETR